MLKLHLLQTSGEVERDLARLHLPGNLQEKVPNPNPRGKDALKPRLTRWSEKELLHCDSALFFSYLLFPQFEI